MLFQILQIVLSAVFLQAVGVFQTVHGQKQYHQCPVLSLGQVKQLVEPAEINVRIADALTEQMACAVVHLMELTGRGVLDIFILEIGNEQFCSVSVVKIHGQMELVVENCHQVCNMTASAKGNGCKLVAVQKQPCAKVSGFSGDVDFLHFPAVVAGISPDFLHCFGDT